MRGRKAAHWAAVVSLIERLTHDDSATPRPVLYDRVRAGC